MSKTNKTPTPPRSGTDPESQRLSPSRAAPACRRTTAREWIRSRSGEPSWTSSTSRWARAWIAPPSTTGSMAGPPDGARSARAAMGRDARHYYRTDAKRAYYLSAEFLLGRALGTLNLGMRYEIATSCATWGSLSDLFELEPDAGLGNGGLGRLAACFLESIATLGSRRGLRHPLRVRHLRAGHPQRLPGRAPDEWLRFGLTPGRSARPEYTVTVHFYGRVAVLPRRGRR